MAEAKGTKATPKTDAAPKTETKVTPKTEAKVTMQNLAPIELTVKEFNALDAAGLRAKLCTEPAPRISRERGKLFLEERVASGRINSITAPVIMDWTYSAVRVTGVTVSGPGFSAERAKKTLTDAEFKKLDAKGKAALIKEFTHKRRAADVILPDLVTAGMPLSAEDVVYLTCGRIGVEGVVVAATTRKPVHAITDGVKFE